MDIFGLIGKPVSHSMSAEYFTRKFAAEECLDTKTYLLFELDTIEDLKGLLASQPDLRGLNVTYPYKKEIIPYLHSLSPEAARIGAVNCVRVEDDGKLVGYNTDYMGFGTSLPLCSPSSPPCMMPPAAWACSCIPCCCPSLLWR